MTNPAEIAFPQFPLSYWLDKEELNGYPKLDRDIRVDAAVVGGGMTGLATAYLLAKRGLKVAVLEAGRLVHGTTGHTTAKITAQHAMIYDELISHFGLEKAKLYYEANREALKWIRQYVSEHGIDCQLLQQDAYIYTTEDSHVGKLEKEFKAYERLGILGRFTERTPLPYETKAAVVMTDQAQFNPLPFMRHLAESIVRLGGQLFEMSAVGGVTKDKPAVVTTLDKHKVTCDYAVIASHWPFNDRNGKYYARLAPHRSYALMAGTVKPYPGGMYINVETPTRSLRSVEKDGETMVIFTGEHHKTGHCINTFQYYERLRTFGEETFGLKRIAYRWSAQDVHTLDNVPYIGQQLDGVPNVFMATGYKKWGMTSSVAAALLNTNLITGEKSPYEELFSPKRFHADPDVKSFVSENADVALKLISGKLTVSFQDPKELGNDQGAIVRVGGKRSGAYRDPEGNLHVVDTTCSHMGCEVDWNEAERTYDCPCHGSRYSYKGDVIEGPAKKPLAKVEV